MKPGPAAASASSAIRSSRRSDRNGPITWTPTGRPAWFGPVGSVTTGSRADPIAPTQAAAAKCGTATPSTSSRRSSSGRVGIVRERRRWHHRREHDVVPLEEPRPGRPLPLAELVSVHPGPEPAGHGPRDDQRWVLARSVLQLRELLVLLLGQPEA